MGSICEKIICSGFYCYRGDFRDFGVGILGLEMFNFVANL